MTAVASTSTLQPADSQQSLSLRQKLLLSQAVVKLGSSDWTSVATLLASVLTTGDPLTAEVCEDAFTALILADKLDFTLTSQPRSRPARKLAHKLYGLRLAEIAASLAARSTEASTVQQEIVEINAGEWDARVLATVPTELRHEVITTPRPIAPAPDSDPPSARASRRKGKAASVERVPDSASEREESVGVKDEDDDSARKGTARKGRARGRRGRDDDGDDDDPTSEAQDDIDTDREMSVPVAGKKSARARKNAPAVAAASRKDRKSSKRKESEAPEPSTPPREGSTRDRKRVKTEDPPDNASKTEASERAHFRRAITQLLDSLFRFERAWPFTAAVLKRDAPTYDKAIQRPLCLVDIIRGVKSGELLTSTQVTRDVALMFANAVQFNGVNDDIAQCARDSWIEFERLMHMHVSQEYGGV